MYFSVMFIVYSDRKYKSAKINDLETIPREETNMRDLGSDHSKFCSGYSASLFC